MLKKSFGKKFLTVLMALALFIPFVPVTEAYVTPLIIKEIESDDKDGGEDFVVIKNVSDNDLDLTDWYITDDKKEERLEEVNKIGKVLKPGEELKLINKTDFDFGLGKNDLVAIYDQNKNIYTEYSWNGHAEGTLVFDEEKNEFVDSIKEEIAEEPEAQEEVTIVINEVQSNDENGGEDWVELYNPTDKDIDISGYILSDDKGLERVEEGKSIPFKENTIIPSKGFLVFETKSDLLDFGLGKSDVVNLYDKDKNLVASEKYEGHAVDTYGKLPDGVGELVQTKATKGEKNVAGEALPEVDTVESPVKINEILTKSDIFEDYIEIINTSDKDVDISGWYVLDDDPIGHLQDTNPLKENTILKPGEIYVFESGTHFQFGLGKGDVASLRDKDGNIVDEYTWGDFHPKDTFSRIPDGIGEFVEAPTSKGIKNQVEDVKDVAINEIESNGSDRDWVEIYNNTDEDIDISGWYIKDDSDDHKSVVLPKGTILKKDSYFVFEEDLDKDIRHFNFGLGGSDKVKLYNSNDELVDEHKWEAHAKFGLSRIPNGVGEFKDVPLTKGGSNIDFDSEDESIKPLDKKEWPGKDDITFIDKETMFLEDTSGLDVKDNSLWVVDNGTAKIWKLDIDENGIPSFSEGYEDGKTVVFKKDKDNESAKGPDAEGITLDNNDLVYIASERDNSKKSINYNVILQVDPSEDSDRLVANREWDITESINLSRKNRGVEFYEVGSNLGIETIEFIPNSFINGKIIVDNTNEVYDSSNYSDQVSDGLFFVGLEDDGYIYVYSLNSDETFDLITSIDTEMGLVMGQNFDETTGILWAQADNGRNNTLAKIEFNGTDKLDITHVNPPKELMVDKNNEGFAIANMVIDGYRPVYWTEDGVTQNALKLGWLKAEAEDNSDDDSDIIVTPGDDDFDYDYNDGNNDNNFDPSNNDGSSNANAGSASNSNDDSEIVVTPNEDGNNSNEDNNKNDKLPNSNTNTGSNKDGNTTDINQSNKINSTTRVNTNNPTTGDNGIYIYVGLLLLAIIIFFVIRNNKKNDRK